MRTTVVKCIKEKSKQVKNMQINIPENLYNQLAEKGQEQGYDNTESYVLYLLEELVRNMDNAGSPDGEPDEEKVKERLRQLGYLE